MIPVLVEFFDVGFLRLIWALFVQYLVATGFLMPEQATQWEQGWGHIISVLGTVVFIAIWQWHSHHKTVTKITETVEVGEGASRKLFNFQSLFAKLFVPKEVPQQ